MKRLHERRRRRFAKSAAFGKIAGPNGDQAMSGRTACAFFFSALLAIGCGRRETMSAPAQPSATPQEAVGTAPVAAAAAPGRDPFSYANYDEVRVSDLALDIAVNFDSRTIDGSAVLTVSRVTPDAGRLVLDTNDLEIAAIEAETGDGWTATTFSLGATIRTLGRDSKSRCLRTPKKSASPIAPVPAPRGCNGLSRRRRPADDIPSCIPRTRRSTPDRWRRFRTRPPFA